MRGIADGKLPEGSACSAALALSMCVPTGRVCAPFFVAAAIGMYALFVSRSPGALLGAAACACVFALGGEAAFDYSSVASLALSVSLSAAFSSCGAELLGRVITGSVIADMYSLFASKGGFLRCTAMGMHTAYYLIFAAFAAAIFDLIRRAARPSGMSESADFRPKYMRAGEVFSSSRVRV